MSRAAGVYVIMFLIFGAGLWMILGLGAMVEAPPDLAGTWKLQPIATPGRFKSVTEMVVQQSGKFMLVSFTETGDRLPMKLIRIDPSPDSATSVDIRLQSTPGLIFAGNAGGDRYRLQTDEPTPHVWNAVRVVRTYPKAEADKKPAAGTGATATTQPTTRAL